MPTTETDLIAALWVAAVRSAGAAARRLPTDRLLVPGPAASAAGAPMPLGGRAFLAPIEGDARGQIAMVVGAELGAAFGADPAGTAQLALEDAVTALEPALGAAMSLGPAEEVAEAAATTGMAVAVPMFDADRLAATLLIGMTSGTVAPSGSSATDLRLEPASAGGRDLGLLHQVEMAVTVELGRTRLTVRELLSLTPGAVVELDRTAGSPVDVLVNGTLIARGEVVVVDEEFGVRISEIIGLDTPGAPRPS